MTRWVRLLSDHWDQVDELLARSVDDSTGCYLTDRIGAVRQVTNLAGTVMDAIAYDGFGIVTSESMPTYGDRFKWTGRELDSFTGLQYNPGRYYMSETDRWLSEDPIRFDAGDVNLYRYVGEENKADVEGQGICKDIMPNRSVVSNLFDSQNNSLLSFREPYPCAAFVTPSRCCFCS